MICKYSPCVTWDSGIFQSWQEFNLFEVFRKYSWSMIAVLEKNKTLILSSLLLQQSLSYTATLSYNLYPWIQTISRANLFQYKKITNYIVAYFGLQGTVAGFGVTDLWLGSPGWCYWPVTGQSRVMLAPTRALTQPPTTALRAPLLRSDTFLQDRPILGYSGANTSGSWHTALSPISAVKVFYWDKLWGDTACFSAHMQKSFG